jgi:preprotein translocase subunit YajC
LSCRCPRGYFREGAAKLLLLEILPDALELFRRVLILTLISIFKKYVPSENLMISTAYAQTAAPAGAESTVFGFLPIILMFALLYFMMIRPQMKKAKEHKGLIEALKKGDEVIVMGMIGKIVKVSDNYVGVDLGDGNIVHMQKGAVTTLLPTGTFNEVTK